MRPKCAKVFAAQAKPMTSHSPIPGSPWALTPVKTVVPARFDEIRETGERRVAGQRFVQRRDQHHATGREHHHQPGCADGGELGHHIETVIGHRHGDHACRSGNEREVEIGRIGVDLRRDVEERPDGGGGYGDHRRGDGHEDQHVRTVVEPRDQLAHIAVQIGVETEPRLDRDRRADQPEAQHGKRIADEQPDQDVVDRRAHGHECGAYDELGRSNVFGTIEAEEVTGSMQSVLAAQAAARRPSRKRVSDRRPLHVSRYPPLVFLLKGRAGSCPSGASRR